MAYECDLGNGQRLSLDNSGTQTIVTLASSYAGQQQQSSCSISTGAWTAAPEVLQMAAGIAIKVPTTQGDRFLQIQGSSINLLDHQPSSSGESLQIYQTHSPVVPMQPLQPLKMGNMQMGNMQMRLGNMEMRMGQPADSARRFCSQCGVPVQSSDRFCSSCGHAIAPSQ